MSIFLTKQYYPEQSYLERAKAYAHYLDGFGLMPLLEESKPTYEKTMWYFLLMAAASGEI